MFRQYDSTIGHLKFRNDTTVQQYGCHVTSIANCFDKPTVETVQRIIDRHCNLQGDYVNTNLLIKIPDLAQHMIDNKLTKLVSLVRLSKHPRFKVHTCNVILTRDYNSFRYDFFDVGDAKLDKLYLSSYELNKLLVDYGVTYKAVLNDETLL